MIGWRKDQAILRVVVWAGGQHVTELERNLSLARRASTAAAGVLG